MKTLITLADGRTAERPAPETIEQWADMAEKWCARYPSPPDVERDKRFLAVIQREPWKSFRRNK